MTKFYDVYVLRSLRRNKFYIGSTADLRKRYHMHNSSLISSTRPRRPFDLCFYEADRNQEDAQRREKYSKTAKGKSVLRTMLREHLRQWAP